MKKITTFALNIFLIGAFPAMAGQSDAKAPAFGISFSGFIKTDCIYDSRQTVAVREGHFLLFPKPEALDADGRDKNAAPSYQMFSLQTRLVGKITGPDVGKAKTSGLIEGEFFGTSDGDMHGFRLRHAYVKLTWPKSELLIGQFWHPMFVVESFPDVVSFDTGAPFQPFNRSPQVRFTFKLGERWNVIATALSQRDFVSNGPDGASSAYARNAVVPELNLNLQYHSALSTGGEVLLGIEGDYKRLRPRLSTTAGYATEAVLNDWAAMVYGKWKSPAITLKAEAAYGQNLHHLTMLGGYAVSEIIDAVRSEAVYVPTETLSLWGEIHSNGTAFQLGLFGGYTKNYGAGRSVAGPFYSRGADIDAVYRLAPRAVWNCGKFRLATEVEYTAAAYGPTQTDGSVADAVWVGNLRLLGAVYLFF